MRCWSGEREIELGPPKQRAVLAPLVLEPGNLVSRERLVRAVWGDAAPSRAVEVVRTTVSRLRRVLGRDAIAAGNGGYWLAVPSELDLTAVESAIACARGAAIEGDLDGAAATYRAALEAGDLEPLADVPGPYAQQRRTAIRALFQTVRLERFGLDLATGRSAVILPELAYARAEDPLCERLTLLSMMALLRLGRQAEALRLYESSRVSLREELGVEPAADLQELHLAILRNSVSADGDLSRWLPGTQSRPAPGDRDAAPVADAGPAPGPAGPPDHPPVALTVAEPPRQLPAPRAVFVGRSDELRELDVAMARDDDSAPSIALVTGPPGVGKTELALRWASATADRFPDGHLFVQLSAGDTPRTVVQSLGVEDPPHDPAVVTAMYRSLTANRRMLVVLDGADSADDVRPFVLTGPDSGIVVTSRRLSAGLVAGDGAHFLRLGALDPDAAVELLERTSGRTGQIMREPAARLADAYDRNPLALRLVASRLLTEPTLSVRELLDEIARYGPLETLPDQDDPHTSLTLAMLSSWRALDAGSRRLLRTLAADDQRANEPENEPDDQPEDRSPAASRVHELRIRHDLRLLIEHNVVELDGPDRYWVSSLITDFVRTSSELADVGTSLDVNVDAGIDWSTVSPIGHSVPSPRGA